MRKKVLSILFTLVLVLSISLMIAMSARAQYETWELTEIKNLNLGDAGAVWVKDNYAYVTTWDGSGLKIVDISDPSNPTVVATVNSPFATLNLLSDLCIQGNYAYVLDYGLPGDGGLFIVDISDPPYSSVVGSYQLPSGQTDYTMLSHIYVSGNYAYVGNGGYGLGIIDVSDPTDPWSPANGGVKGDLLSQDPFWYAPFDPWTWNTPALGIFAEGDYVYITSWDAGGVWIFDVSDPTLAYQMWDDNGSWSDDRTARDAIATDGLSYDVVIHNGYAYIAEQDDYGLGGLTIIPIAQVGPPADYGWFGAPIYLRALGQIHDVTAVDIKDNLAFIVDDSSGLSVLDVSDPSTNRPR